MIEVDDTSIYHFPEGVYGFEDDKEFALFERAFDDVSFLFLQSVQRVTPCFLVFEPGDLYPQFEPILSSLDLKFCGADTVDELMFLLVTSVPTLVKELSINLKSPIILNPKTQKAKQVFLKNRNYPVRFYPFLSGSEGGT